MNKIENFLTKLTQDTELYQEKHALMFTIDDNIQLIFTRDEGADFCYVDILVMKDFSTKKKFEFDLPISSIYSFLRKHLDESHFLINNCENLKSVKTGEEIYNDFMIKLDKISMNEIKAKFLQIHLEITTSEDKSIAKKHKI